ncbi:MAG: D-alanyl-D-alanine carboxypeptidase [Proteobacteria bacterium]|nr:D-alanyl-D-alanine carboxypeptidase [Pseudomonadota bacterium]
MSICRFAATVLRPHRPLAVAVLIALLVAGGSAAATETPARQAILVDMTTGSVLLEKNADELVPPASMSKIMTLYMVFERLKDGSLSLDDTFLVSAKAWRKGGSKMFVEVDKRVRVEDLLRGVIVSSGNDAAIVLAEGLAGTEELFAEEMTRRAREIGLEHSVFKNATGWPDPEHLMTARDLAILAQHTIENFPGLYPYYAETTFTYNGIRQENRNPLLNQRTGADGLKTGHTEASGYGLTASVERDGRRLILVVNGLAGVRERAMESARLIEWGLREFDTYALFKAGEVVEEAEVWFGEAARVPLVVASDVVVTLPRKARVEMTVTARYEGPIPAPIEAGAQIAKLVVSAPGIQPVEFPLVAGAGVERLGLFGRLSTTFNYLLWGVLD